jgi:phosphoribosylformimino-5-aminoimidazole carboxamide ribotide isomerase
MILYPAIDILDGEVVRLVQGDFAQKTVYAQDPKALLTEFVSAGATHAHLVDLSGARDPRKRQTGLIKGLLEGLPLKIQVGGGIRSLEDIDGLLKAGADRVVVGSLATSSPGVLIEAIDKFGADRLTLALDVKLSAGSAHPAVMSHGWAKSSGLTFAEALAPFAKKGLRRVLCTDISVDGRPVGPNIDLYESLLKQFPDVELQASGGVSGVEDIEALREARLHSVVVGRALLAGIFTLREALKHA